MAKLRWERTKGVCFDPDSHVTAESVAAKWEQLCSFSESDHPANVAEAAAVMSENLGIPPERP